jgi:ATP-dependent RNA helicase RhlE
LLFQDLNLIAPILKALETEGYTTPTPIQAQAIPVILEKKDILGCAQTGTGKTAAFAIPILQLLAQSAKETAGTGPRQIKALILTPTRELAIQIDESFAAYGKHLRLKHAVVFGGVSQFSQVQALRSGIDVLIATPGRLLDLVQQKFVNLHHIEIFVLDEADRMLDMGFITDVKKIITKIPQKRQTLFFSATMPLEIASLANTILNEPVTVEVAPVSSTVDKIQQLMYFVERDNKRHLLLQLLQQAAAKSVLIFTRTKHGADKVVKELAKHQINAEAIHGNKSQNARQRALTNFKSGHIRVLVATDIAARGIDVDHLELVINYELPNIPETYVHRIGRTGRAGAAGTAYSFCDAEERLFLRDIQKTIKLQIPVMEDHQYHMPEPAPVSKYDQQRSMAVRRSGSSGPRSGGGGRRYGAAWRQ